MSSPARTRHRDAKGRFCKKPPPLPPEVRQALAAVGTMVVRLREGENILESLATRPRRVIEDW
jgi:hypothetical protein